MEERKPICVGICGYKKSGKTMLIEQLLDVLIAEGLSVGVVKHHNEPVEADTPGTDTYRFYQSGADVVGCDEQSIYLRRREKSITLDQAFTFLGPHYDLILVEGFKESEIPKLWLLREGETEAPASVRNILAALDGSNERLTNALQVIREYIQNAQVER
jgi:molybdopterin-guanine dinucleotide biosynthesis adapter protein